jgi:hypothetical protein
LADYRFLLRLRGRREEVELNDAIPSAYLFSKTISRAFQRNQQLIKGRTAKMNTRTNPTKTMRIIHAYIVDVIEQKGGGYTVVLQTQSDEDVTSEEIWRMALPGDFRGATRVDRLWHLYYGQDPGYSPGASLDVTVPNERDANELDVNERDATNMMRS